MADNDYVGAVRKAISLAVEDATARGASSVEAEHLLLALADQPGALADVLDEFGLDRAGIERMLRAEREAALAAIGYPAVDETTLQATPRRTRPSWGASAREAIARGAKLSRRDRQRLNDGDLALGILLAELGTVPRALVIGGVDRDALAARIRRLPHASR